MAYARRVRNYRKMKNNYRKILFVCITAFFILTATGVVFALHLTEHDKDQHHDSENCPICQLAAMNKNFTVLSSSEEIYPVDIFICTISYKAETLQQIAKFQLPQLRAPPL